MNENSYNSIEPINKREKQEKKQVVNSICILIRIYSMKNNKSMNKRYKRLNRMECFSFNIVPGKQITIPRKDTSK